MGLSFDLEDLFYMISNLHSSALGSSEGWLERFIMPAPTRVGLVIKEASLVLVLGGGRCQHILQGEQKCG